MTWARQLGPLGPMAAIALVAPPVSGVLLLGTMHQVGPWLQANGVLGVLLYLVAFATLGGLALLPTYAQAALGGWAFGVAVGVPVTVAGFVGAALVGYAVARRVSGDRLERLLRQHSRWRDVHRALVGSGFAKALLIVTLLRLPPNAPFAASNVAMAALGVPLGPYVLGTALGLAPRTSVVVFAGAGLATLDLRNPARAGSFAAGVAVSIAVLIVLGWIANRALRHIESHAGGSAP